jgi:antitoxin component of RelBE/YafQ-DinJ toxin-antitoxin module
VSSEWIVSEVGPVTIGGRFFVYGGCSTPSLTKNNCCIYFGYMKTVLNVKTDKDVKEKAQAIAKEMGVPLSIIVNSYLKFFIKTRTLVISLDPKVNDEISKQVHKQLMILRKNKV